MVKGSLGIVTTTEALTDFGQVLNSELQGRKTPDIVRRWAESPPAWLIAKTPIRIDPTLPRRLHKGEVEAISLAQELNAELILVDDWDARRLGITRQSIVKMWPL